MQSVKAKQPRDQFLYLEKSTDFHIIQAKLTKFPILGLH